MSDNKRNRRSFNSKGYYIALILCAAAIGISGYLYERNRVNEAEEVSVRETEPLIVVMEEKAEDLPVIAPREEVPPVSEEKTTLQETESKVVEEEEVLKVVSPVAGQEIMPYSVEALSYNETTRDWRIHDGVDLSAEEGAEVCSAANGKVYTTYEDDNLGHTVVILHDGGYTTRYSSLNEELLVKAGDQVTAGQPIGYAGTSALLESAVGPHVHFSVTYREKPMDPGDFLKLG